MMTVLAMVPRADAGCPGCDKVATSGEGFHCDKGEIYTVKLGSEKLYKALAGHAVDPASMKCAGCKAAALTSGTCAHCNVGIANGKAYHSMVSHTLAKGELVDAEHAAKCKGCTVAFEGNGKCTGCNVGFVAHRMFKGDEDFKAAKSAHAILAKAAASKCEACAIAMVTDGKCEHCKVSYKDGKKVS